MFESSRTEIDETVGVSKPAKQGTVVDRPPVVSLPKKRRVTIGFDFGTSTSKCCFREEGHEAPFHFVAFASGECKNTTLYPTVVAVKGNELLFGPEALTKGASLQISSFKMCLLCQAMPDPSDKPQSVCRRCLRDRPGHFAIGGRTISAEDLCTLHVATALTAARQQIGPALKVELDRLRLHLNAAGPLDQMDEFGSVGQLFENVMFRAFKLSERGSAKCKWNISEALKELEWAKSLQRPERNMSPTSVFPETHAACLGYMMLPECEQGLFGIVDIGAGTTDVSFFWLQKDSDKTEASYYTAGTLPRGMDDVDRAISDEQQLTSSELRARRSRLSDGELEAVSDRFKSIRLKIYTHYWNMLDDAMKIDQRSWFDGQRRICFRLLLVGGGGGFRPLTKPLQDHPPFGSGWKDPPIRLPVPLSCMASLPGGRVVPLKKVAEAGTDALLLLAYGLAHPRPDIPKYMRDRDGVSPVVVIKPAFSPDEFIGHT